MSVDSELRALSFSKEEFCSYERKYVIEKSSLSQAYLNHVGLND